jgi:ATP-dependent Clp protease ATP-binding subunit ClpB
MRFDKLTTKFQQALADAQSMASRSEHPYIEPVHVLSALLADTESGASSLLSRAGVAVNRLQTALEAVLKGLPKVKGGDDNIQASRDLHSQ